MKVEFIPLQEDNKFGLRIISENISESIALKHFLETPGNQRIIAYDSNSGLEKRND